jgi:hypothetical protein
MSFIDQDVPLLKEYAGQIFGGYKIISFSHYSYDKSGNKSHQHWNVECIYCKNMYVRQKQKVVEGKLGCKNCKGNQQSGNKSVHWKGGEHVPGFFVAKIKKAAVRKTRTLEFDLSFDYLDNLWISQQGRCAYTDEKLWFGRSKVSGNASLDRIDSAFGYIEGNVQFVHKDVNIMKWDLSEERFLEICKKITKNGNDYNE